MCIATADSIYRFTIATGKYTKHLLTGSGVASFVLLKKSKGLVFIKHPTDPAQDFFLVRAKAAAGALWKINAETFDTTELATTGGAALPAGASVTEVSENIYQRFQFLPQFDCVVYVPSYGANAWVLRVL